MKPQDIVVLFKIITFDNLAWTQQQLSAELVISQSEISAVLKRLHYAGLLASNGAVNRMAFLGFLIYGLKYIFPQRPGAILRGIPTAHSASFVKQHILSEELYVWPTAKGTTRGQAITPLYKTVPKAVQKDSKLYHLLVLADLLRVGKVREVNYAKNELTRIIKNA